MKIYDMYDEEQNISVGTLLYYEKEDSYIIELQEYLDEWTAPLLFVKNILNEQYTVSRELSRIWVDERVIPSGRQNIGSILSTHKLKEYNEMSLLDISEGRCSQDSLCIKKLDNIPQYVRKRAEENIVECTITEDNQLLCIFTNGKIKKIDIFKIEQHVEDIEKIRENKLLFESVKVGTGGYMIMFNDAIEISARILYKSGKTIQLTKNDLMSFVKNNVMDTSECCELLECSRQNLSYLVNEGYMTPIRENVKGNLYLKGDVLKNRWG